MQPFYLADDEIGLIVALRQLSAHERAIIEGAIRRTALAAGRDKPSHDPLPPKVVPLRNSR